MISMIYHLDQCWDDEMSILKNLTKKHIKPERVFPVDVTWNWTCQGGHEVFDLSN